MDMLIRIMKSIPSFSDFSDEELLLLVNLCDRVSLQKGEQVFAENQQDDHAVYLIQEGIVKVQKGAPGREKVLAMFGMGNIFGEMSFLDHAPRSATVVADENVVLGRLLPGKYQQLEQNAPRTALKLQNVFMQKLIARLRQTDEALVEQKADTKIIVT